jgi:hypothetical protein
MASILTSILGGSIPDVGGLTGGLPSIPAMPSIPNPSSLLGKLPIKPPGLNAALDKINVLQDELKEKMGDLKLDLSANIGSMKASLGPLTDKLKESVSLSAGDIKIPTKELKKEMESLLKQLGTGSSGAASTFAGISTSFPSFDLLGIIKKAAAPSGPMDVDATTDDGPGAPVELFAKIAAAGGGITERLNVGRAEAGLPLFEPDDSGPAFPGEEEGGDFNFESDIPNQQIIDGEVVEKANPTEAPDVDAMEPDFPPENPIPAIAINSIGLAAVSSDLMGKLSGLIGGNASKQMLKAESISVEMRNSIKNKFFGSVVKMPKIDLENLSNISGLKPIGTIWKSPGGSGGFLAAMEKEGRKTKAIISRSMAAPGGGSLLQNMMKLANDQDLHNSMKAQTEYYGAIADGIVDKDYSEDPNAAAKGISYDYPESED